MQPNSRLSASYRSKQEIIDLTGLSSSEDEPPTKKLRYSEAGKYSKPLVSSKITTVNSKSKNIPHSIKLAGRQPQPLSTGLENGNGRLPRTESTQISNGRVDFDDLLKPAEPRDVNEGRSSLDRLLSKAEADAGVSRTSNQASPNHVYGEAASGKRISSTPPNDIFSSNRVSLQKPKKRGVPVQTSNAAPPVSHAGANYKPKGLHHSLTSSDTSLHPKAQDQSVRKKSIDENRRSQATSTSSRTDKYERNLANGTVTAQDFRSSRTTFGQSRAASKDSQIRAQNKDLRFSPNEDTDSRSASSRQSHKLPSWGRFSHTQASTENVESLFDILSKQPSSYNIANSMASAKAATENRSLKYNIDYRPRSEELRLNDLDSRLSTPILGPTSKQRSLEPDTKLNIILKAFNRQALPIESKILPPRLSSPRRARLPPKPATQGKRRGRPPKLGTQHTALAETASTLAHTPTPSAPSASSATPRFDASNLPKPNGGRARFTPADEVILIYFKEVRHLHDYIIDERLGRDYWRSEGLSGPKKSSTCGIKYFQQLRYGEKRDRLNLRTSLPALLEILKLDMTIEQTRDTLNTFMEKGILPPGLTLPPEHELKEPVEHKNVVMNKHLVSRINFKKEQSKPRPRPSYTNLFPSLEAGHLEEDPPWTQPTSPNHSPNIVSPLLSVPALNGSHQNRVSTRPQQQINYNIPKAFEEEFRTNSAPQQNTSSWHTTNKVKRSKKGALLPYLSKAERKCSQEAIKFLDWTAVLTPDTASTTEDIHVNFTEQEIEIVLHVAEKLRPGNRGASSVSSVAKKLRLTLSGLRSNSNQLLNIASNASEKLSERTSQSVRSFCIDIINGDYQQASPTLSIKPRIKCRSVFSPYTTLSRETGDMPRNIRERTCSQLVPTRSFNEMSGDVDFIAFSPLGNHFAASGCCLTDNDNMQYNNSINLVIGDLFTNKITELADHWTTRPKTAHGANSTDMMLKSQDSRLFHTVPMIQFSSDGRFLYSVGYDGKLNSYDTSGDLSRVTADLGGQAALVSTSRYHGLIATGVRRIQSSIAVFSHGDEASLRPLFNATSGKSAERPDLKVYPSSLKWGHAFYPNLLTAGFSSSQSEDIGGRDLQGEICMWDIRQQRALSIYSHSGSVFDLAWSPIRPIFAAALASTASGAGRNKWAKSHIRVYNDVANSWKPRIDFDCRARDINDIVFCPYDDNYVAAGTTDGSIYVYDQRKPNETLHVLNHDMPLAPARDILERREDWDSGVRFCAWGASQGMLVTGSSDGVIKTWDITRGTPHTSDLACLNSGITSAAFSPDFTSLVVGEINRTVTLFEIGTSKTSLRRLPRFDFVSEANGASPANDTDLDMLRAAAPESRASESCPIPQCAENKGIATELTISDRYLDRIPDGLMAALTLDDEEESHINDVPRAMKICTDCGRPCRPWEGEQETHPLCEICGFSCFRCGTRIKLTSSLTSVNCTRCCKEWYIGSLGYHLKQENEAAGRRFAPDELGIDLSGAESVASMDKVVEDDHAELYHSLWRVNLND